MSDLPRLNTFPNTVSVISVASRQVVATIPGFKEPRQAIVFTRDNQWAYVLNEDLSLAKVDRASQRVVSTLAGKCSTASRMTWVLKPPPLTNMAGSTR